MQGHYLNECFIVNWITKLLPNISFKKIKVFENTVCNIFAILFRSQYVNILKLEQSGRHFADDNFKCISWIKLIRLGNEQETGHETLKMHNTMWHHHDDVIKWKHFPRYWPFVWGFHRWQVNSPHKGQWRGALMFSLICVWINGWVNNREAGELRPYRAHYNVIVITAGASMR